MSEINNFPEDSAIALLSPVTIAQFGRKELFSPSPVVADFFVGWCGRVLAQVLERFVNRYSDKIRFLKADVDDDPELSEDYDSTTLPTLLFFQRGLLLERHESPIDLKTQLVKLDRLAGVTSP